MSQSTEDLIRELESGGVLGSNPPPAPVSRPKSPLQRLPRRGGSFLYVILAVILVAIVGSLPFGDYVLYPFALFVTLLHETGHALAATLTGGSVESIKLSGDLSGLTTFRGGVQALVAPAGYLGATLVGVLLLVTTTRLARIALGALATVPLATLLIFHPASLFTGVWCVAFAVALIATAWKLGSRSLAFLQLFVGVEAGLNAFRDVTALIFLSGQTSHITTDADQMSRALFLPSIFWAVLWTVLSILMLAGGVTVLIRREFSRSSVKNI